MPGDTTTSCLPQQGAPRRENILPCCTSITMRAAGQLNVLTGGTTSMSRPVSPQLCHDSWKMTTHTMNSTVTTTNPTNDL